MQEPDGPDKVTSHQLAEVENQIKQADRELLKSQDLIDQAADQLINNALAENDLQIEAPYANIELG